MATSKMFDHYTQQLIKGMSDNQIAHEDFGRFVEKGKKRLGSSQKSAESDYQRTSLEAAEKLNEVREEFVEVRGFLEENNIDINDPVAIPTIVNRLDMPADIGFGQACDDSVNIIESIEDHIVELEKCRSEERRRLEQATRRIYGLSVLALILLVVVTLVIVQMY